MRSTHRSTEPAGFSGKLALVTGAGHGIGRSTAIAFARAGAIVIAVDRDAEAAAKTAADTGGTAEVADVADAPAMQALADRVHEDHGVLDVLVNNAGVGLTGEFLGTGLDDWTWLLDVNLRGVIHGCKFFGAPMVQARRGHVVNVSSLLGYTPRAGQPAYVTSKAAVLALTRSLRADWCRYGVGVTALCPGLINTGILTRTRFVGGHADGSTRTLATRAFERGTSPDKVADAVLRAVVKNKAVVPVGLDAHLAWAGAHLLTDFGVHTIARAGGEVF